MSKRILCSLLVMVMILSSIDFNVMAVDMQDKAEVIKANDIQTDLEEITDVEEQESIPDEKDSEQEDQNGDIDNEKSGQEGDQDSEEDSGNEDENVNSGEGNSEQEEDSDLEKENSNTDEMESDTEDTESDEEKEVNLEVEEEKDDEQNVDVKEAAENQQSESASYGLENHNTAEQFAGGNGTKEDPYQISDIEELNLFAMKAGVYNGKMLYYKLVKDIRLNESSENPVNSWMPIDNLRGCFDGDGHKIENLYIRVDRAEASSNIYIGLFGTVEILVEKRRWI